MKAVENEISKAIALLSSNLNDEHDSANARTSRSRTLDYDGHVIADLILTLQPYQQHVAVVLLQRPDILSQILLVCRELLIVGRNGAKSCCIDFLAFLMSGFEGLPMATQLLSKLCEEKLLNALCILALTPEELSISEVTTEVSGKALTFLVSVLPTMFRLPSQTVPSNASDGLQARWLSAARSFSTLVSVLEKAAITLSIADDLTASLETLLAVKKKLRSRNYIITPAASIAFAEVLSTLAERMWNLACLLTEASAKRNESEMDQATRRRSVQSILTLVTAYKRNGQVIKTTERTRGLHSADDQVDESQVNVEERTECCSNDMSPTALVYKLLLAATENTVSSSPWWRAPELNPWPTGTRLEVIVRPLFVHHLDQGSQPEPESQPVKLPSLLAVDNSLNQKERMQALRVECEVDDQSSCCPLSCFCGGCFFQESASNEASCADKKIYLTIGCCGPLFEPMRKEGSCMPGRICVSGHQYISSIARHLSLGQTCAIISKHSSGDSAEKSIALCSGNILYIQSMHFPSSRVLEESFTQPVASRPLSSQNWKEAQARFFQTAKPEIRLKGMLTLSRWHSNVGKTLFSHRMMGEAAHEYSTAAKWLVSKKDQVGSKAFAGSRILAYHACSSSGLSFSRNASSFPIYRPAFVTDYDETTKHYEIAFDDTGDDEGEDVSIDEKSISASWGSIRMGEHELELVQELLNERHKTLLNLARCRFKDKDTERALNALNTAIKLDPNNPKGYLLRGKIYLQMGNIRLGRPDVRITERLVLSGQVGVSKKEVAAVLSDCERKEKEQKQKDKRLVKNMMAHIATTGAFDE